MADPNVIRQCAEKYQEFVKNRNDESIGYQVKFFDSSKQKTDEILIRFYPSEFMHLASLGKVKDLWEISFPKTKNRSSNFVYEKALKGKLIIEDLEKSPYFYEDSAKPDDITEEEFQQALHNEREIGHVVKSDFTARLDALEHLYETFDNLRFSNVTLELYQWQRYARKEERPYGSKIEADFLFEFCDSAKPDKPFIEFFVVQQKGRENEFVGMSIFPREIPISTDRRKSADKMEILALKELTFKKGTVIAEKELIPENMARTAECMKMQKEHEAKVNSIQAVKEAMYSKQLNNLKTRRLELIKVESKVIKNESKIAKAREYYNEFVMKVLPARLPDNDDLIAFRKRLETAKNDVKPETQSYIDWEIKTIDAILMTRKLEEQRELDFQGKESEYTELFFYIAGESNELSQEMKDWIQKNVPTGMNQEQRGQILQVLKYHQNEPNSTTGREIRKSDEITYLENIVSREQNQTGFFATNIQKFLPEPKNQHLFQISGGAAAISKMPDWKNLAETVMHGIRHIGEKILEAVSSLKEKIISVFSQKADISEESSPAEMLSVPDEPDTATKTESEQENNTKHFYYMGEKGILRYIGEYQKEAKELVKNLHLSVGWFRKAEQELKQQEEPQKQKKQEDYER